MPACIHTYTTCANSYPVTIAICPAENFDKMAIANNQKFLRYQSSVHKTYIFAHKFAH